eukprot:scaffold22962_cov20-Prasinocladus_malaysianus.AAC.1
MKQTMPPTPAAITDKKYNQELGGNKNNCAQPCINRLRDCNQSRKLIMTCVLPSTILRPFKAHQKVVIPYY